MSNNSPIDCPVDFVLVNQNKIRLIALLVWLLALTFWITRLWFLPLFLVADFSLRAFGIQKYSPLGALADILGRLFHIKSKPVDQAPKRFAAQMGLAINVLLLTINCFAATIIIDIILVILIFFSFLESFFGICVGCHIYSYSQKIKKQISN